MSQKLFAATNPFKNAFSCVSKAKNNAANLIQKQSSNKINHAPKNNVHLQNMNEMSLNLSSSHLDFDQKNEINIKELNIDKYQEFLSFTSNSKKTVEQNEDCEYTFKKWEQQKNISPQRAPNISFRELDSIDRHLNAFLQNEQNLQIALKCLNKSSQIHYLTEDDFKIISEDQKMSSKQELEQPLDFDALRQQQLFQQDEALTFIPQLAVANLNYQDSFSPAPAIDINQPSNHYLMLDLKFNVQKHLNTASYKNVTRTFLTFEETIKTKKYVLSN